MHKSAETCLKLSFLRFPAIFSGFQGDIGGRRMVFGEKNQEKALRNTHPKHFFRTYISETRILGLMKFGTLVNIVTEYLNTYLEHPSCLR